jgi:hypothetical protein
VLPDIEACFVVESASRLESLDVGPSSEVDISFGGASRKVIEWCG